MTKLKQLLKSRQFWTAIFQIVLNFVAALIGIYPTNPYLTIVNVLLLAIQGYLKVNPSQAYSTQPIDETSK